MLKEYEGDRPATDIVRELGIAEQTFYNWKRKYGDMNVSEVKRLKQHEALRVQGQFRRGKDHGVHTSDSISLEMVWIPPYPYDVAKRRHPYESQKGLPHLQKVRYRTANVLNWS